MKNKNTDDEPLWFSIMMWIIVIVVIFGILFLINHFTPKEVPGPVRCSNECNKFDMEYYKIDYNTVSTFMCWCLDNDRKPRSVGSV
ncbi:MAG: hypothetical protein AABX54_05660 [Nanoarchaeota archaeon]